MPIAGKRVLITGATSGIGLAGAKEMLRRGALLTVLARDEAKGHQAVTELEAHTRPAAPVDLLTADLASQAAVRDLAAEVLDRYPRVDVLINNAGVGNTRPRLSEDGIELTWAVNHLAPFLFTALLCERLVESAPARIVTTASAAHSGVVTSFEDLNGDADKARGWGARRYRQTKLANILFTIELARRLRRAGVTANCFHPGSVASGLQRDGGTWNGIVMRLSTPLLRSAERAAATMVWLAEAPEVSGCSGGYFVDGRRVDPAPAARDLCSAAHLWRVSAQQVGIYS